MGDFASVTLRDRALGAKEIGKMLLIRYSDVRVIDPGEKFKDKLNVVCC